jgi:hypothetical protein
MGGSRASNGSAAGTTAAGNSGAGGSSGDEAPRDGAAAGIDTGRPERSATDEAQPTRPGLGAGDAAASVAGNKETSDAGATLAGARPTFALAGYGAVRAVSRDLGRTWVDLVEEIARGGDDKYLLRGLGCGNGLCVAGGGTAGATGRLLTTSDGKTWTEAMTGAPGISDVAFGNGIWVGVSGHYGVRSDDGSKWRISDNRQLGYGGILRRMRFAGRRFLAWGDGGKCTSTEDGLKWDKCQRSDEWSDVGFGAGLYVAVGAKRATSVDGVKFESAEELNGRWIVWTGTQFVVGGASRVSTSPDGKTWTHQSASGVPQDRVAYGAGVFVSPTSWSMDGVKWTAAARTPTMNGVTDIDFTFLKSP